MIADETAFRAAIRANPGDATARLVYADYLDEQGRALDAALQRVLAEPHEDRHRLNYAAAVEPTDPERAEFVRVQCELARLYAHAEAVRPMALLGGWEILRNELQRRERERWEAHCADWLPHLPGASQYALFATSAFQRRGPYAVQFGAGAAGGLGRVEMLFARGFLSEVVASASDWSAHGDAIRERHPVARVSLTTTPASVTDWAAFWSPRGVWDVPLAGRVVRVAEGDVVALGPGQIGPASLTGLLWKKRWPGIAFDVQPIISAGWGEVPHATPI